MNLYDFIDKEIDKINEEAENCYNKEKLRRLEGKQECLRKLLDFLKEENNVKN